MGSLEKIIRVIIKKPRENRGAFLKSLEKNLLGLIFHKAPITKKPPREIEEVFLKSLLLINKGLKFFKGPYLLYKHSYRFF